MRKNLIRLGNILYRLFSKFSLTPSSTGGSAEIIWKTHLILWNKKSFFFRSTSTVSKLFKVLVKIQSHISRFTFVCFWKYFYDFERGALMTHWRVVITLPSIHFQSIQLGIIESKSFSTLRPSSNTEVVSSIQFALEGSEVTELR